MKKTFSLVICLAFSLIISCDKEDISRPESCFELPSEPIKLGVPFTIINCSKNADSYKWSTADVRGNEQIISTEESPSITMSIYGEAYLRLVTYSGNDSSTLTLNFDSGTDIGTYISKTNCEYPYSYGQIISKRNGFMTNFYNHTQFTVTEFDESYNKVSQTNYGTSRAGQNLTAFENGRTFMSFNNYNSSNQREFSYIYSVDQELTQLYYKGGATHYIKTYNDNCYFVGTGANKEELWVLEMDSNGTFYYTDTTFVFSNFEIKAYHFRKTDNGYSILVAKENESNSHLTLLELDSEFKILDEINIDYDIANKTLLEADYDDNGQLFLTFEKELVIFNSDLSLKNSYYADHGFIHDLYIDQNNIYLSSSPGLIKFDLNLNIEWELSLPINVQISQNGNNDELVLVGTKEELCGFGSAYYIKVSKDGVVIL